MFTDLNVSFDRRHIARLCRKFITEHSLRVIASSISENRILLLWATTTAISVTSFYVTAKCIRKESESSLHVCANNCKHAVIFKLFDNSCHIFVFIGFITIRDETHVCLIYENDNFTHKVWISRGCLKQQEIFRLI